MRILYLTNIPAPYRVEFFNQLAEQVDLTVVYEEHRDGRRDDDWLKSAGIHHDAVFLDDQREVGVVSRARAVMALAKAGDYDLVVVGCYNSQLGIACMLALKHGRRRYFVNVDGMYFPGGGLKKRIRNKLVAGADGYLVAGERTYSALLPVVGGSPVFPYHFSSLTRAQIEENSRETREVARESFVLCVAQYEAYKGLDVLIDAALELPQVAFKLVGSGGKADALRAFVHEKRAANVEVIPFLQRKQLSKLYAACSAFVLPSRQECWALVINEALSFGAPVVSTWGAGAAVELIGDIAPERLAKPDDAVGMGHAIASVLSGVEGERAAVDARLCERARGYSIEAMVEDHVHAFKVALGGGK